MDYDLEEQQEPEQFTEEQEETKLSKDVYQYLKEKKKFDKLHSKPQKEKHKATFHRINNINHYICDNCKEPTPEENGSLIYKATGEFFYCKKCLKELYPNYRHVKLVTSSSKTDFLSNHFDTKYNKGFK